MLREDLRLAFSGLRCDVAAALTDIFGSSSQIYKLSKDDILSQIELNARTLNKIMVPPDNEKIEREMEFIEKYKIRTFTYGTDSYPPSLADCADPPILLYAKGNIDFLSDTDKWVAFVGTRKCTSYGIHSTEKLIEQIAQRHPQAVIVSGLAYGIDSYAHRAALRNNLRTV
ncbi:MAG: DNA-processing protein DprA, partial [Rikenellaceae bacterium]